MERVRKVRERLDALRRGSGLAIDVADVRKQIRTVIVVVSASRGGSSFLAEFLRRGTGLMHLRGELNPLLGLCDQTYPVSGTGSDLLTPTVSEAMLDDVGMELGHECGVRGGDLDSEEDVARFALDLACRLTVQWHELEIELSIVERCLRETLAFTHGRLGWPAGRLVSHGDFHALLLGHLRRTYPAIDPSYYDIDPAALCRWLPSAPRRRGPPASYLLEEPPFICIEPWRLATSAELATWPLVVKTPSNAYRMGYLQALFPNAELRILHLTRNPAASINGLYEGWQHGTGFFSHCVKEPLSIRGYSDDFPEWGTCWWNFDLPPNWHAMRALPLEEVCALQWSSIHRAALDHLAAEGAARRGSLRLKFEDIVSPRTSADGLRSLEQWLRVGAEDIRLQDARAIMAMPAVMATGAPGAGRWRKRADRIEPLTRGGDIQEIAENLGYGHDVSTWI
jgi:hypothetical protein